MLPRLMAIIAHGKPIKTHAVIAIVIGIRPSGLLGSKKALITTETIQNTQIQPEILCKYVPFFVKNCHAPNIIAQTEKTMCIFKIKGAWIKGAKFIKILIMKIYNFPRLVYVKKYIAFRHYFIIEGQYLKLILLVYFGLLNYIYIFAKNVNNINILLL